MKTANRFIWVTGVCLVLALCFRAPPAAGVSETYEYDAIGRLTRVTSASGGMTTYTYDPNGNILSVVTSLAVTGVDESRGAGVQFALGAATPNPGSGGINISFSTPASGHVGLRVFDVAGRLVATAVDGIFPAGSHVLCLDARRFAGGVYFYRLEAGGLTKTRRFVVIR